MERGVERRQRGGDEGEKEREKERGREIQEMVFRGRGWKKGRRAACDGARRSERRCPAKEERGEKEKAESITI